MHTQHLTTEFTLKHPVTLYLPLTPDQQCALWLSGSLCAGSALMRDLSTHTQHLTNKAHGISLSVTVAKHLSHVPASPLSTHALCFARQFCVGAGPTCRVSAPDTEHLASRDNGVLGYLTRARTLPPLPFLISQSPTTPVTLSRPFSCSLSLLPSAGA